MEYRWWRCARIYWKMAQHRGSWWKTATVRLLTPAYCHNLTCSSVNILWHRSGSIVITLRTNRISFSCLETQHSVTASGRKPEISCCRPVYLIICAGLLGDPFSQIREICLSPERDEVRLWRGQGDASHQFCRNYGMWRDSFSNRVFRLTVEITG